VCQVDPMDTPPQSETDPNASRGYYFSRKRGVFEITDDPQAIDFEVVYDLIRNTYWAGARTREVMARAMANSICLGLLHEGKLIGFARSVTDRATFAWICDVVVHPEWRKRGLGKWLVESLLEHPAVKTRTQALVTVDAQGLYERYGFERQEYLRRGPPIMASR
jgi:ribosomal protein S18 acetylase RimI-like enzyme